MPPYVIALLGGIGSGKSAVAAEFAALGAAVIDADRLGHEALREPAARDAVAGRFGPGVLDDQGHIDRKRLGAVVFADGERLAELERIVHPIILAGIHDSIAQARRDGAPLAVLDAAVLLEAGWDGPVDRLVFVDAPEDARRRRVAARGWDEAEWRRREAAQLPLTHKRGNADHVVDNSSDREHLRRQVRDLMRRWGHERLE